MVEVMKIMATSFKRSHAGTATLSALNPHLRERLLDAYGQFWVSLLWGHCFFLLAILIPACASSSLAFLMMHSAYKLNKQGDNIQP